MADLSRVESFLGLPEGRLGRTILDLRGPGFGLVLGVEELAVVEAVEVVVELSMKVLGIVEPEMLVDELATGGEGSLGPGIGTKVVASSGGGHHRGHFFASCESSSTSTTSTTSSPANLYLFSIFTNFGGGGVGVEISGAFDDDDIEAWKSAHNAALALYAHVS